MDIEIISPLSGGSVKAIASKTQAHRILICAALSDEDTYVKCAETSDDIDATVRCLQNLGAGVRHDGAGYSVEPAVFPISENKIEQRCDASGSTLRFMLPICCALGITADFIMDRRLSERPMRPLLEQLEANGCAFDAIGTYADSDDFSERNGSGCQSAEDEKPQIRRKTGGILKCSGKLGSGQFLIPGNITSQFISGLLLALPMLNGDSMIDVEGRVESMPYITVTLDALRDFGIIINSRAPRAGKGAVYLVKGSQQFISPKTVSIEGDWSNAAFWLSAGAITGSGITCTGLNLGSSQGDIAIIRLLERFGANVAYSGDSVTVSPAKLRGIHIDTTDTPDLVPPLSVVAAVAQGETVIYNSERLRTKESDRLRAVKKTLNDLGADVFEAQDGLIIRGRPNLRGGTISSLDDHRIAMMAAIASVACENPVKINSAGAVTKSYPGFFQDFEKLGGKIRVDSG